MVARPSQEAPTRRRATARVQTTPYGESRTKQSFRDETDINVIMARYRKTGQISHLNGRTAVYGDFSSHVDLLTSMTQVSEAQAAFEELPAKIRDRFSHDPVQLLAFVDQADNRAEAIELGLVADPAKPEGSGAPVKPAAPAAPTQGAGGDAQLETPPASPPQSPE